MEIRYFRISTLRVLLSQILNFTTSDTRQDGQSSPFTTSSLQRVPRMRNCRASIVADTEKPLLMKHQRLYPLLLLFIFKKNYAGLFWSSSDPKSSPRGDERNSPHHSEDSPRARTWCILLLLLLRCGKVVRVALCCPHVVWSLPSVV